MIITTSGMASKLIKFVYKDRVKSILPEEEEEDEDDIPTPSLSHLGSISQPPVSEMPPPSISKFGDSELMSRTSFTKTNMKSQTNAKEGRRIKKKITEMMGSHGKVHFLQKDEKLQMMG